MTIPSEDTNKFEDWLQLMYPAVLDEWACSPGYVDLDEYVEMSYPDVLLEFEIENYAGIA